MLHFTSLLFQLQFSCLSITQPDTPKHCSSESGHQLSACEIPLFTFCKDRAVFTFESFSKSSADTDNKFEFVEITS
jgi:hypothetical protein